MKIALLYPYWDDLPHRPVTKAMDVVGVELSTRLAARDVDVTLYSTGNERWWRTVSHSGVRHRLVPTFLNGAEEKVLSFSEKLGRRSRNSNPKEGALLYQGSYGLLAGLDMRTSRCAIAHICIFDQTIPIVRRLSPKTRVVLHMHDHRQMYCDHETVGARLSSADLIVGVSDFTTNQVRDAFPSLRARCRTILNAVDCDQFTVKPERHATGRRLLFNGRLSPEKGVHTILEAFSNVLDRHPDAELDVVGPDSIPPFREVDDARTGRRFDDLREFYTTPNLYGRHLREKASRCSANSVRFIGAVSHSETVDYYQGADVFLFPSIWDEPFGLPVIEAMAAGLPVVSTRVGAIPEIVIDGVTGLLVEPGDSVALAAAVARLLDDEPLRAAMGAAGRARAEERFSWRQHIDQWVSLYEELAGGVTSDL